MVSGLMQAFHLAKEGGEWGQGIRTEDQHDSDAGARKGFLDFSQIQTEVTGPVILRRRAF